MINYMDPFFRYMKAMAPAARKQMAINIPVYMMGGNSREMEGRESFLTTCPILDLG
jgi:hypothetical protein